MMMIACTSLMVYSSHILTFIFHNCLHFTAYKLSPYTSISTKQENNQWDINMALPYKKSGKERLLGRWRPLIYFQEVSKIQEIFSLKLRMNPA